MIHLAYDGSINGDWVAWYAQNLARQDADRTLRVLYINTDEISAEEVHNKVTTMESASSECGVSLKLDIIPSSGPGVDAIFRDLLTNMPTTPGTLLVCGARLNARANGYLAGTVSERLLSDRSFDVMAVRVAQPGLLGAPHRFLIPIAGDREGFLTSAEIMRRFSPTVTRIHMLRVMMIKRLLFRRLQHTQVEQLRQKGWESMADLDRQLAELSGVDQTLIDTNVTISDDWAHEVIIAANRHKSHLILMEAAWKNLRRKFHYGNPIEVVLRDTPCDVAIYRGV